MAEGKGFDADRLAYLDDVLEELHDSVCITDGQGTILKISRTCGDLYGIDPQEYVGRNISLLEESGTFAPSVTLRVLREKRRIAATQPDKNGQPLLVTGVPILDHDTGEIAFVVSYSSWEVANIKELQRQYNKLRAEMQLYSTELQALRGKKAKVELVAESPKMRQVKLLADKAVAADMSLLIIGEAGAGKTVVSRYIHSHSQRSGNPFVQTSCSAFQEDVLRDELFGYVRVNKATGEEKEKAGLCQVANGGTLLLEDIECLAADIQNRLLYMLKNGYYFKPGSEKSVATDVRIIGTTRLELRELSKKHLLNDELYYRLSVAPISVPSLKERKEDIPPLADAFIKSFNKKYRSDKSLSQQAIDLLLSYNWPGNVRELKYLMEQLVVTTEDSIIRGYHLPGSISPFSSGRFEAEVDLRQYLSYYEGRLVRQAYAKCKTTTATAKFLGISQASAVRKLQKYLHSGDIDNSPENEG